MIFSLEQFMNILLKVEANPVQMRFQGCSNQQS